ncbi:PIN domain-containing protein [Thiohalocapsa marina]|uniref:PIN domain-containing protein n=1 Tax=Thiohalocapsa marina TaxID=424902 RepID=A0A5M8FK63_9GAMM|nr:PIN domain-containing protein [Thiohalocapsa marina]KAA6185099.1 PIN domain-containing protein [Thiohalocapsa marina]
MIVKPFVDTNILIYAYDRAAADKHHTAALLLRSLWQQGGAILSAQVLQEFYVNVTRKIPQPLTASQTRGILKAYCAWQLEPCTCETIMLASEVQERHQLSFWDGLILASAAQGGAELLLSEDLNARQIIEGVRIVNPFHDTDPDMHRLLRDQISESASVPYWAKSPPD